MQIKCAEIWIESSTPIYWQIILLWSAQHQTFAPEYTAREFFPVISVFNVSRYSREYCLSSQPRQIQDMHSELQIVQFCDSRCWKCGVGCAWSCIAGTHVWLSQCTCTCVLTEARRQLWLPFLRQHPCFCWFFVSFCFCCDSLVCWGFCSCACFVFCLLVWL